jgi:hypothetical protein
MKQPGIFFAMFGAAYLVWSYRGQLRVQWHAALRSLAIFGAAAALPFALLCFLLWRAGLFERFWFWVFTYARLYGSLQTLSDGLTIFWQAFSDIVTGAWPVWILACIGLAALWKEKARHAEAGFLTMFLALSFLAVCPGL